MTLRRPMRSARAPQKGALRATPRVAALTVRPTCGLGGVEDLLEERQQRLGGVEIEKRADPGEGHRDDGARVIAVRARCTPEICSTCGGLTSSQHRVGGLIAGELICVP